MELDIFFDPDIREYIHKNENRDVSLLALEKFPFAENLKFKIFEQIKSRQKARNKLPSWYKTEGIIFPNPQIIEQCSSEACALYKASLFAGESFVDLTAGAGIDTVALAHKFSHGVCVDHNSSNIEALKNNLPLMKAGNVKAVINNAESYINEIDEVTLIYIDPERRQHNKKALFKLEQTTPNILLLIDKLLDKAEIVAIKTSPMLDIHTAIEELRYLESIHIVEYNKQCKEIIYIATKKEQTNPEICAVNIDDNGHIQRELRTYYREENIPAAEISMPCKFIYEPGPAFMKSGAYNQIAHKYQVKKLHTHTHLFTSDEYIELFPGRCFILKSILNANKKELSKALPERKANLSIRNFPQTQDELRKKLKIADGGENYLFACTLADDSHVLLHLIKPHKTA
jgi:16S rRNA G966 N2-methylase RsmD